MYHSDSNSTNYWKSGDRRGIYSKSTMGTRRSRMILQGYVLLLDQSVSCIRETPRNSLSPSYQLIIFLSIQLIDPILLRAQRSSICDLSQASKHITQLPLIKFVPWFKNIFCSVQGSLALHALRLLSWNTDTPDPGILHASSTKVAHDMYSA